MEASERLASLLEEAGAVAAGTSRAGEVEPEAWRQFEAWLEAGHHAGMEYMRNYPEIRRDPRLLLEGARTVISTAFNYRQPNPYKGVATYALGEDYHKALRRRLKKVVAKMRKEYGGKWRICIDSAPILERYWAQRSGIGTRSSLHGNIVVPGAGSMVFLAELITDLDIDITQKTPRKEYEMASAGADAGKRVCPTGALQPGGGIDARRCINYLTIEHRGDLTAGQRRMVGDAIFGCDICLRSAPENRGEPLPVIPEFLPLPGLEAYLEGKDAGDFDISRSAIARQQREKHSPDPDKNNRDKKRLN